MLTQIIIRNSWTSADSTITYEPGHDLMVNTGSGSLDAGTGIWTADDSGYEYLKENQKEDQQSIMDKNGVHGDGILNYKM